MVLAMPIAGVVLIMRNQQLKKEKEDEAASLAQLEILLGHVQGSHS
jgi:hypothetical protein